MHLLDDRLGSGSPVVGRHPRPPTLRWQLDSRLQRKVHRLALDLPRGRQVGGKDWPMPIEAIPNNRWHTVEARDILHVVVLVVSEHRLVDGQWL